MIQLSNVEVKVILQAKQTEMNSSTQTTMSGYSLDTSQISYYLPLEELELVLSNINFNKAQLLYLL